MLLFLRLASQHDHLLLRNPGISVQTATNYNHRYVQTSNPEQAPTFARFAASLALQDKHKRALVQSSIQLNMKAGNNG